MQRRCRKEPDWCREWFNEKLINGGYKMTMPRQVVLDALINATGHPSAEDIYIKVHNTYPEIGLTTVYRTLELLVQMGVVAKFDFGDGRSRYEISESPENPKHHHHLVCTNCKRIIDYTDFINDELELLKRTEKGLSEKFNFKITGHEIQFYGLCDKCNKG
jgi:Fur family ferric uptake transcriptional regulator